jgi:hypothetical protein
MINTRVTRHARKSDQENFFIKTFLLPGKALSSYTHSSMPRMLCKAQKHPLLGAQIWRLFDQSLAQLQNDHSGHNPQDRPGNHIR